MNKMEAGLQDTPAPDKAPWIDRFGEDPDSWNINLGPIGFNPHSGAEPMFDEDDNDDDAGDGSGLPGVKLVTEALQGLANCWGEYHPASAARVFNLPPELVDLCTVRGPFEQDPEEVHPSDLGSLLAALVGCPSHDEDTSVALAARITNQHPIRIVEAVAQHPYAYLTGNRDDFDQLFIGLDGE